jgi:hypothetical protein
MQLTTWAFAVATKVHKDRAKRSISTRSVTILGAELLLLLGSYSAFRAPKPIITLPDQVGPWRRLQARCGIKAVSSRA